MGVFVFEFRDRGRVARVVAPNTLMYRSHDLLFGGAFGDLSSGEKLDCELGISAPAYRAEGKRPNFDSDLFSVGPRNRLDDYEGDYGNEGGMPDQSLRDCEDYARKPITWTITRAGRGTIIDSGFISWVSRIPYEKLGSDKPPNWDTELHPTGPRYHEPDAWGDIQPWENQSQDWPWASPRESRRWWYTWDWTDLASVVHTEDPQSGYPATTTGADLGLQGGSVFPIGQAYVAIERGEEWEILAAANVNGPAWWRRSGSIFARYVGRWGV